MAPWQILDLTKKSAIAWRALVDHVGFVLGSTLGIVAYAPGGHRMSVISLRVNGATHEVDVDV